MRSSKRFSSSAWKASKWGNNPHVAIYIAPADSASNGWPDERLAVRAVAGVLPFQTNSYVVDDLIDCHAAADDPIYLFVFSSLVMLPSADVPCLADLLRESDSRAVPQNKRSGVAAVITADDEHAARLLITSWMSAPGRALRAYVSPHLLTVKEPITFLADEQITTRCVEATGPTSRRSAR